MTDETEIDLRPYILELFRKWYLIIFIPLLFAVATYLYFNSKAPYYKASAMVAVTEADFFVNFESGIRTSDEGRPAYQALPIFATGSELVSQIYDALDPKPENINSTEDLAEKMEADSGDDVRLIFLTATMLSPEDAARVANIWADLFIEKAHSVYSETDDDEVVFYETQMADNEVELEKAEQDLIDFQSRNQLTVLRNELNLNKENHLSYMRQQNQIESVTLDLEGLSKRLSTRNSRQPATFVDQLSFLSLQTATYNAGDSLPIFFQLPENFIITEQTVGEQLVAVDDLLSFLQEKYIDITDRIEELQPNISSLQEQIREMEIEESHLERELSIKREIDSMLARKIEEVNLASEQTPSAFRVAGKAVAPIKPAGPKKLTNTAVAGVLVGILTVCTILFRFIWISSASDSDKPERGTSTKTSTVKRLLGGKGIEEVD